VPGVKPRQLMISILAIVSLAHLVAPTANAQFCFRGKPAPECRSFLITEIGLGLRVGEGRSLEDGWPASEIGWMYNLNEHYAVGATSYIVYDAKYEEFRGGLKLRVRRWLNNDFSLNASGGAILLGGEYNEEHPEFAGHVDLNYKDFVGPYVGVDVLRGRGRSSDEAIWHTGIRFGSYAGTGLSSVAAALVVAGLYSYAVAG
jgi:hypothetical protein